MNVNDQNSIKIKGFPSLRFPLKSQQCHLPYFLDPKRHETSNELMSSLFEVLKQTERSMDKGDYQWPCRLKWGSKTCFIPIQYYKKNSFGDKLIKIFVHFALAKKIYYSRIAPSSLFATVDTRRTKMTKFNEYIFIS